MKEESMKRIGVVFGIIFLFLGTSLLPSLAYNIEKVSPHAVRGSVLYVGGNGPGNYTKIQDAINTSNPGDTVFVYNDSSPYYEHLVIQKSITLVGEEETSTEINGSTLDHSLDTINVTGNHVTIQNFRITDNHGFYYQAGVKVMGDFLTLSECIVQRNEWIGISLVGASSCQLRDCDLHENLVAVNLVNSRGNVIENFLCHENADGITLYQSSDGNHLINCMCASNSFDNVLIQQSTGNEIKGCICQNGYDGLSLPYAAGTIMRNNTLEHNYANFGIGSSYVSDFYCDIDTSNTINGKPIYYLIGQHNLLFDEHTDIGFLGLIDCQNISVRHGDFTNNFEGILLANTTGCFIENCSFVNNDGHGMYMISSSNNTVKNSSFQNSFWDGVFLFSSSGNTVERCSCSGSQAGISLGYFSMNNLLTGVSIDQCRVGVSFDQSANNVLRGNTMSQCGLKVAGSTPVEYINDVDLSNTVNGRPVCYYVNETNQTIPADAGQVILVSSNKCTLSGLNLSNASIGIELAYSRMNLIEHNSLVDNRVVGIDLDGANNNDNVIKENTLQRNNYGIDVDSSTGNILQENRLLLNGLGFSFDSSRGNTIIGNTISEGYYGMYFDASLDNTMTHNTIRNTSQFGLYLFSSGLNILRMNTMINCSLLVYGNNPTQYFNDVDTTNTVNGKPLYYLNNQNERTIPEDAGEVILANCNKCAVKNLELDKATVGIILAYSSNNTINSNRIRDQSITAIDLSSGYNDNTIIQDNIIQGNGNGIDIEYCTGTLLKYNTIISNSNGVFVYHALNSNIRRNTIVRNYNGINAIQAEGTTLRWNNIFLSYIYGLTVDACTVSAPENWWGATTGPAVNGNGNGDHLDARNNGEIISVPWHRLPILFTGFLRFLLTSHRPQENHVQSVIQPQMIHAFNRGNSDDLAVFGIKTMRQQQNPMASSLSRLV
jgi:parallel beta-helix repeat protein